jgi:predicted SnoaL-like aldol condensation-catalyzing enzyme
MNKIKRVLVLPILTAAVLSGVASSAVANGKGGHHGPSACVRGKAQLDRNSRTVVAFYTTAVNFGNPARAVEKYVGVDEDGNKTYTQHNPLAADGPQAFIDFFTGFKQAFPLSSVDIKRVIAECDLVVTHSHFKVSPTDTGSAVMDIFRLDAAGKVVEHWDVIQQIPATSANDNGMF